ncbi:hypothetical protein BX070DRAFT_252646 [Coemansia spiralis]|nr:hypothetical protein BX070DRAFT_252646 [Coemansia spiralis]
MSQLLLRAVRSFGSAAHRCTLRQPHMPIIARSSRRLSQLQLADLSQTRLFTDKPTLRQAQVAMAKRDNSYLDEESPMLMNPDDELIAVDGLEESKGLSHYLQTGRTLTEQLSVLYACLSNGNIDTAQRMFTGLFRLYPEAMKEIADVSVHNEIIGGMLSAKPRALTTNALMWYDKMEKQYGIKPNVNTFAIMIGGFINCRMRNVAIVLMQEMLRRGFSFHSMLLSSYLNDGDIENIKKLAQMITSENSENSNLAAKLLQAVNEAEENLAEVSSDGSTGFSRYLSDSSSSLDTVEGANRAELSEVESVENTNISDAKTISKTDTLKETELISTRVTGIDQLKETLKTLYDSDLKGYNLQVRLERETYDSALARFREINEKRGDPLLSANTGRLRKIAATWLPQLESLIEEEQARCAKIEEDPGSDRVRGQYGQFLRMLDAPKIAIITILETLRQLASCMKDSLSDESTSKKVHAGRTLNIVNGLSKAVHDEIKIERLKKRENRHILGRNVTVAKLASSGKLLNMTIRRAQAKELRDATGDTTWIDAWDSMVKIRIGSMLLSLLIESARVPEHFVDPMTGDTSERMVPAFNHGYIYYKGRRHGIITPHNMLKEMFSKDSIVSIMTPRHLPMLVPPRPWLTYNHGGYLTQNEPCMRFKDNHEQLHLLKQASNDDRLYTLLSGLDALGQTRWAINRSVFAAVSKVWNSGREMADIPPSTFSTPEPQKPEDIETDKMARAKYYAELREWRNSRANQHSIRCDCNYKVEIAKAFLNHPMYFPHNIDFRGRAYPIPPHFNHLGNDLCRGLLIFHEGRPITKRGLYWLKIHLANLYGKDKLSHDERLEFIDAHEKDIMASADEPVPDAFINGEPNAARPWWIDAENPWQALASCIEYAAALRSPNPEEYVSHLHIHQDGTCNGLQHYAAMGRDTKGAIEVNLLPSDRPQDVYAGILNVVMRLVEEDSKDGVSEALILKDRLTRKIVKQTVMTNVYGVTLIGARDQIAARLREVKDDNGQHVFDILQVNQLAMYVAKKIFASLGEMFTQAQQIQNWLNESARRIAKSMHLNSLNAWKQAELETKESKSKLRAAQRDAKKGNGELDNDTILGIQPELGPGGRRRKRLNSLLAKPMTSVVWTTPLGLTVSQPYRNYALRQVNTPLQSISVYDTNMPSPVNSQKQKTAFPPNFVHSLDASHMILSAIECKVAGLVFASVHDSYWTHACDIDRMNAILRDQFVKLHERSIMDNLKAEFERRYANYKMPVMCWEYIGAPFSWVSAKDDSEKTRLSKKEIQAEREQNIEAELAKRQLQRCQDHEMLLSDDLSIDGSKNEANEALNPIEMIADGGSTVLVHMRQEHIKIVDLKTLKHINPKKDLIGAMKQADCIIYTLAMNKKALAEEQAAVKAEYKANLRKTRQEYKDRAKAKKTALTSKSKKGETPTPTPTAATTLTPDIEAKATGKEEEDIEAIRARLENEKNTKLAALSQKYVTEFEQKPILATANQLPAQFKDFRELVENSSVSGRFVERMKWADLEFDPLPHQGDFDIKEVLKSPYFFS